MRLTTLLFVVACAFFVATPAAAIRCLPTQSSADTTLQAQGATLYVIAPDDCPDVNTGDGITPFSCVNSYIYRETNGLKGLQRLDDQRDDTCGAAWPADQQIW